MTMFQMLVTYANNSAVITETVPNTINRDAQVSLNSAEMIGFSHRVDLVVEDYRRRAGLGLVRSDAEPLEGLTLMPVDRNRWRAVHPSTTPTRPPSRPDPFCDTSCI